MALVLFGSCEVNHPPSCTINEPTDGFRAVRGDVITVTVSAGDEEGEVSEVRLYLNKSTLATLEYPFHYEINTADFRPGNYSIEAVAVDNEGIEARDEVDFILHPLGWNDSN